MYHSFFSLILPLPTSTLFPYTTLFRSWAISSLLSDMLTMVPLADVRSWKVPPRLSIRSRSPARPRLVGPTSSGSKPEPPRSEEHTSELQTRRDLVCRLLLEKKKIKQTH